MSRDFFFFCFEWLLIIGSISLIDIGLFRSSISSFFLIKSLFYFLQFFKVTFHLQLLQNIDYIPHFVQYLLEPTYTQ